MFHIFAKSFAFDPRKIASGMKFRLYYWIFCPNYIGNRQRGENSIINVIGNELGTFYAYNIIFFAGFLKGYIFNFKIYIFLLSWLVKAGWGMPYKVKGIPLKPPWFLGKRSLKEKS